MDLEKVIIQVRTGMGAYIFTIDLPTSINRQALLKAVAKDAREAGGIMLTDACKFQVQQDQQGRAAGVGIGYIGQLEQSEHLFIPFEVIMGFAIIRDTKEMDAKKLDALVKTSKEALEAEDCVIERVNPSLAAALERERHHGGKPGNRG